MTFSVAVTQINMLQKQTLSRGEAGTDIAILTEAFSLMKYSGLRQLNVY
jgi:hypothetical protein